MRHQTYADTDDDMTPAVRANTAAAAMPTAGGASPAGRAQAGRPTSPPWVPVGHRPGTSPAGGGVSPRQKAAVVVSSAGGRGRVVEHTHLFPDDPRLAATHPMNFFWLYASYDFKLQTPYEQAKHAVCKLVDRMVDRLLRQDTGTALDENGRPVSPRAAATMQHAPPIGMMSDGSIRDGTAGGGAAAQPERPRVKGHFIFDLIATKKHIGPQWDAGLPHRLGQDIYRYIDDKYGPWIVTTFVGLSDNTARRVGRDVYYSRPDDNLSRTHAPFTAIDNEHMFVVFPPRDTGDDASGKAAAGGGAKPAAKAEASPKLRRASPSAAQRSPRKVTVPRPGR